VSQVAAVSQDGSASAASSDASAISVQEDGTGQVEAQELTVKPQVAGVATVG